MNEKKYLLGIDQGGTKTIALICDAQGHILGTGYEAGLETVYFLDEEGIYLKRIRSAAETACTAAGISLSQVSAACGCLNGADWDFEYPILTEKLRKALNIDDVTVLNDCIGAMRGGTSAGDCAVICAGSGLNAAVRRADGKEIIYGYYVDGAHQGGGALGTAALRKVMEAYLGICGETLLTGLILGYTGHDTAERLMIDLTVRGYDPERKHLAPFLLRAYAAGDVEAAAVVEEFVRGVARYITAGMKRLGIHGKALDLVFSGSVFKDLGSLVADRIHYVISETEPSVRKVHARYEPVCGAALTVLDRLYENAIPREVNAAFAESAEKNGMLRNTYV